MSITNNIAPKMLSIKSKNIVSTIAITNNVHQPMFEHSWHFKMFVRNKLIFVNIARHT